jgi:hypothetical protein
VRRVSAPEGALDGIKYLDFPEVIQSVEKKDVIKGRYCERIYDFLSKGGKVATGFP